eukprot:Clim_evm4s15 gene=Clim_evmTU4s15
MGKRTFKGWAAFSKDEPLHEYEYEPKSLDEDEIEIQIDCCGICGSDVHTIDSGWGPTNYPVIVGHEIAGTVTSIGSQVTKFNVGDRVGVGCMLDACFEKSCKYCASGRDAYCPKRVFTYNDQRRGKPTYGGYQDQIIVPATNAFKMPENITNEEGCSLLCAGVTLYSPMKHYGIETAKKIGIIGIGGLGHVGLQFARAFGEDKEVVAISHSDRKKEDAMKLGATDFLNSSDKAQMKKHAQTFDLIFCTANPDGLDLAPYTTLLDVDGTLVSLGLPETPIHLPKTVILNRLTIGGSLVGSTADIEEMLEFASKKNIKIWHEDMPMDKVNDALEKFRSGDVRYRIVLKN